MNGKLTQNTSVFKSFLGAIYTTSNANTLWVFRFVASSLLFSVILFSDKGIFVLLSISKRVRKEEEIP